MKAVWYLQNVGKRWQDYNLSSGACPRANWYKEEEWAELEVIVKQVAKSNSLAETSGLRMEKNATERPSPPEDECDMFFRNVGWLYTD
jgi:hypothetical protein